MNWLNLNIQTLDSENFLGSDPTDRATWLCLLRYCIGQENGGVIADCLEWGDRKWQQLVRVTKKEAERKCDLWGWSEGTLTVWGYPSDKEGEIQQKRDRAKTNGAKGGRPKKTEVETEVETDKETKEKPTSVNSAKAEGERKGKEGEGKGKEHHHQEEKIDDDDDANWWTDKHPTDIANRMIELQSRINSLHPSWTKRPHFSAKELHALHENAKAWLAVEADDWALLQAFMFAKVPDEWRKDQRDYFQPDNRLGLIGIGSSSILSVADKWAKTCKRHSVPTGIETAKAS